jgi:hypothetical protein
MKRLSLLVLLFTLSAGAAEKTFTLKTFSTRQATRTQLFLHEPGDIKAIRVYAMPSKTLLALFGNEPMSKSEWFERTFPKESRPSRFPAAWFEFRPDATIMVTADRPAIGDDSVAVYVYRGGKKKEEKLVERTNPTEFLIEK